MKKIALRNGLTVYGLSATDTDIVYSEIFEQDVYRRHGVKIENGDCIVDIGANTGLFPLFLNQICTSARIFAYEPIPAVFETLRHNLELHDRLGTRCFQCGVSRSPGEAAFTYYPRLSCASTMLPDDSPEEARRGRDYVLDQFTKLPWPLAWPLKLCPPPLKRFIANRVRNFYRKSETVTCPLTTVSAIIREHALERIDFLKVDAERAEHDILAGIAEEDWPKIRQTVVEVHDGEAAMNRLCEQLRRRGFNVDVERNEPFTNIFMVYAVRPPSPLSSGEKGEG